MKGNDRLDIEAAQLVMRWKVHHRNTAHWMSIDQDHIDYRVQASTCGLDRWSPTRNIKDAMKLVERIETLNEGFKLERNWDGKWSAEFAFGIGHTAFAEDQEDACVAITLAAIGAAKEYPQFLLTEKQLNERLYAP